MSSDKVFDCVDENEQRRARRFGTLVWADQFMLAYLYKGNIYLMEPPEQLRDKVTELLRDFDTPAHSEKIDDGAVPCPITLYEDELIQRAVLEAGFSTEAHREMIAKLLAALKERMYGSELGRTIGFAMEELQLVEEAKEFLSGGG